MANQKNILPELLTPEMLKLISEVEKDWLEKELKKKNKKKKSKNQ